MKPNLTLTVMLLSVSLGSPSAYAEIREQTINLAQYLSEHATGGDGTPTNPWTGWGGALAPDTTHIARPGHYEVPNGGLLLPAGAKVICEHGGTFQFPEVRMPVVPMFTIAPGSSNVLIQGCKFEPGIDVPPNGLTDGTGGSRYIYVGAAGNSEAVENLQIVGNTFGVARYSGPNPAGGHIEALAVQKLQVKHNTFDACATAIITPSGDASVQMRWQDVEITDNIFSFSQISQGFGNAIQVGNYSTPAYPLIVENLIINSNEFYRHNGTMAIAVPGKGITVTNNVARSNDIDHLFIQGPGGRIDGLIVAGNIGYADLTPEDPTPTGTMAGILLNDAHNAIVQGNVLFGHGFIGAIWVSNNSSKVTVINNTIDRDGPSNVDETCVEVSGSSEVTVSDNVAIDCNKYGVRLSGTIADLVVSGNHFLNNSGQLDYMVYSNNASCTRCVATNNRVSVNALNVGVQNSPAFLTAAIGNGVDPTKGDFVAGGDITLVGTSSKLSWSPNTYLQGGTALSGNAAGDVVLTADKDTNGSWDGF